MKISEIKQGVIGIYMMILNNNKIYIGLSNDIRRRMNEHLNKDLKEHPEILINKAIIKYGLKDIQLLEIFDKYDRKILQEREKYWIKKYNSYLDKNIGYNLTVGGDGASAGVDNNSSYLNKENLEMIYNLLLHSKLSYEEIARQTNSSYSIVSRINNGNHYYDIRFSYPIRKCKISRIGIENKTSIFYNNENMLYDIIKDLKNNLLSQKEISSKYDISISLLSSINKGDKYKIENEKYPLRNPRANSSHKRIFTNKELDTIKYLLLSKESMSAIAKILKCDRKVISDINKGERQHNNDWKYPIR